uniref:Uncharacterized protein n=1 Tax=Candidatus Methanophaga sp. ANME-1 ERB7 TaxID=2759913 RepID=A0A7G9Z4D4_9EURY|nr:hypothetical protein MNNOGLJF_00032 [Methanosarcinales archaeon ANME-1 ERB7]
MRAIKDREFVRDSLIMLVTSLLAGFLNYLYKLPMARLFPQRITVF